MIPIPFTHPQAPTLAVPEAGDASLALTITPPSDQGTSGITGYEYSTDAGRVSFGEGLWRPIPGGADPGRFVMTSDSGGAALVNGREYSIAIRAVNSAGSGPASQSVAATPVGSPDTPRRLLAAAGDRQVHLSWRAPASDGGSRITGYRIAQRTAGGAWRTVIPNTARSATNRAITGLSNGTEYRFRVAALSAVGVGPWSDASTAVVPTAADGGSAPPTANEPLVGVGAQDIGRRLLIGAGLLAVGGVAVLRTRHHGLDVTRLRRRG